MPIAKPEIKTVTIANGASLSDVADIGAGGVRGFNLPVLTTAVLTFQGSADGVTFNDVRDAAGVEVQVASSAGGIFVAAPTALAGVPFLKVRSGTSAAPVAQGAQRVISVVVK